MIVVGLPISKTEQRIIGTDRTMTVDGVVPITSREELNKQIESGAACKTCDYSTAEGYSIYENRPLPCRMFGTFERLKCAHGCRPEKYLTDKEVSEIHNQYFKIRGN